AQLTFSGFDIFCGFCDSRRIPSHSFGAVRAGLFCPGMILAEQMRKWRGGQWVGSGFAGRAESEIMGPDLSSLWARLLLVAVLVFSARIASAVAPVNDRC